MPPGGGGWRGAAAAGALLCLWAAAAAAGGLTVLPVTIALAPGQLTSSLLVRNEAETASVLQVRPFVWSQSAGGDDRLEPTAGLQASPPIAAIPGGASQVVRLVLRRPATHREATYRILLDQIPPPAAPGTVRIALRLSIPVFAEPVAGGAPALQWRIAADNAGARLTAVNLGNHHARVFDIALAGAGWSLPVGGGGSPYILARAGRIWPIPARGPPLLPGTALRLSARSDAGPIRETILVGGP